MCTTADALSVASMRTYLIPIAAALGCAAAPATAHAAGAVYGGSGQGEPIVVTANKTMKKLATAVVSWSADCDDGMRFPFEGELAPAKAQPGFSPGPGDLVMSRNARGRFSGTTAATYDLGDQSAAVIFALAGRLSAKRASGTLSATVKIIDKATGDTASTCQTGKLSWGGTRDPGKVFGGTTSQGAPVVLRVDPRRHKVTDLMLTWHSSSCTPESFTRYPDQVGNFRLSRSGAFGDPFTEDFAMDGGGKRSFAYQVAGRVGRTAAHGSWHVTQTDTDGTGAQTVSCDSGGITWKALTG